MIFTGLPTLGAIATHRFAVVFLELVSVARFAKVKKLNIKIGVILGIAAAIGAIIGTNVVINLEENILNIIVSILLLLVAIFVFKKDDIGVKEKKITLKSYQYIAVIGSLFILGIYGGFFGAGFGTFNLILLSLLGYSFLQAAGITRIIGLLMSSTSAIIFIGNGLFNYQYAFSLGPGYALGSWIGINIAIKKGNHYIRNLLLVIVILTAVKLVFENIWKVI